MYYKVHLGTSISTYSVLRFHFSCSPLSMHFFYPTAFRSRWQQRQSGIFSWAFPFGLTQSQLQSNALGWESVQVILGGKNTPRKICKILANFAWLLSGLHEITIIAMNNNFGTGFLSFLSREKLKWSNALKTVLTNSIAPKGSHFLGTHFLVFYF